MAAPSLDIRPSRSALSADMRDIDADIAIIGSGPTGAAAAWRLATAGLNVVVIEKGQAFDAVSLDRDGADWELRRAGSWSSNPNIRRAPEDDPVDDSETPIKPMFASGTGGTSTHWSAHTPRFRPEDFRVRTLDGVGSDWPIAYDDLAPFYELAEARWGVAFQPGDPSAPPRQGRPQPLPTIGAHGRRFAATFDALGWHWWPVDLVVGSEAGDPATAALHASGPATSAVPAASAPHRTRRSWRMPWPPAHAFLTGVRVTKVETGTDNRAIALVCRGGEGLFSRAGAAFRTGRQRLRYGAAVLALLAPCRRSQGLANRSGLVGRGLMLHPYAKVDALFDEPLGGGRRARRRGSFPSSFCRQSRTRLRPGREAPARHRFRARGLGGRRRDGNAVALGRCASRRF